MTYRFTCEIQAAYTELRLIGPDEALDCADWAVVAPQELLSGVDLVRRLAAADQALEDGNIVHIEHGAVASLSKPEAARLGMPPFAEFALDLSTSGNAARPDYTLHVAWKRPNGQALVGAARTGAWLQVGAAFHRLPRVLFDIAELCDRHNAVPGSRPSDRMAILAALRDVLPQAESEGQASSSGLIGRMTIAVADSFSLDMIDAGGPGTRLVPVLHRAGADDADDTPLLLPDQQRRFGDEEFNRYSEARGMYALGAQTYVVLTPILRTALNEVRRVQSGSSATKRAFLAAPRAFLRSALGEDVESTMIDRLVRDTPAYAERVTGLGLWQARVIPWIKLPRTDWTEGSQPSKPQSSPEPKPSMGLLVGSERITLTPKARSALRREIEAAISHGEPVVLHVADGRTVPVPANETTLAALASLPEPTRAKPGDEAARVRAAPEVLLIADNEEEVAAEAHWLPRQGAEPGLPRVLRTPLKAHQADGLRWLQEAWCQGRPGVLLADDMGLGKTLQALAFLAWLLEGMNAGKIIRAPLLVVAPTGLLGNWQQEIDTHLAAPGLGRILPAYGHELAKHRHSDGNGRPRMDIATLRGADCALTTYETLRDYDLDFGQIRFAAIVFDEAQKIKTPGIRLTDAAKAMNAEFRIALTGTPIENRLADLWCIVDTIHPSFLGDLKHFSSRYEATPDTGNLQLLKRSLDTAHGGRPPLLLRRLRIDHLPDLPTCTESVVEEEMPPLQREAYEAAGKLSQGENRAAILSTLHHLRASSLHPDLDSESDDDSFICESARLIGAFRTLDDIAARHERVLIFVDDRRMQARIADVIQRRYRLARPPMIISGAVPGDRRQRLVNQFQAQRVGFDAMILSPRAGGVGLTLTSANHVIHLDRWWNPAVEDQCTGRVLRIGQTRPVAVHIPLAVCKGRRSFDQNLQALLARKRILFRETLMPGEIDDSETRMLLADSLTG